VNDDGADAGQLGLWPDDAPDRPQLAGPPSKPANPCLLIYGPGPEGRHCRDCSHLYLRSRAGRYWKCDVRRGHDGGPVTDHRVGWPACAKFDERAGDVRVVRLD
jgi:hypothetical protein